MLQAYSRLKNLDPEAAEAARRRGEERARSSPFRFDKPAEFEEQGFVRAVELLRQGEIELSKAELSALGLLHESRAPAILWGVALLYKKAGALRLAHSVAAGLLTDWLSHWPTGPWSEAWRLAFPRPYLELVFPETQRNQIDEFLAYAVMREESAFDPSAQSPANAYGLMQLIVPTARSFAQPLGLPHDPRSLTRPEVNIKLGCRVLGELTHKTFAGQPLMAIPGYNAGPGRPRKWLRERPNVDYDVWIELIPLRETRRYTKRVLTSRAVYAALYHPELSEAALTLPLSLL
jgi:soluble lytic murein transglycosylase